MCKNGRQYAAVVVVDDYGGGGSGGGLVLYVRTYINDFPTYTNPKYAEHFLCISGYK